MVNQLDRFQIRKCGYSRKPWRIIDTSAPRSTFGRGHHPDGTEVWAPEILHLANGAVRVTGPVAFDRKRDAAAWLAEHASALNTMRVIG